MTKANPELSDAARTMVETGAWRIDPDAGHIYGKAGKRLRRLDPNGYIKIKVRCADGRQLDLEAVTVGDNVRHAVAIGLRPGRKGATAANAKLTDDQVRDIYRRCATERVADIAREHGVAYWTISSIKHGRAWTHVTGASATA